MKGCRIITVFLFSAALLCQQPDSARAQHAEVQQGIVAGGEATAVQPFIVYYSRTGSGDPVGAAWLRHGGN